MWGRVCCVVALLGAFAAPAAAETQLDWAAVKSPSEGRTHIYGSYAAGCIAGAQILPESGKGYQVVRMSRNRFWGHPQLIDFVEDLARQVYRHKLGVLAIGDIGQPRGGPMPFGHSSHQIGLDVDIFYRLDPTQRPAVSREDMNPDPLVNTDEWTLLSGKWGNAQADVIRLAALDRHVARIFVHPVIKRALCQRDWPDDGREPDWLAKVRPWYGHDGHFHVRLKCPRGQRDCVDQADPVQSSGCGAELQEWFDKRPPVITKKKEPEEEPKMRPMPNLPSQCQSVLLAPAREEE